MKLQCVTVALAGLGESANRVGVELAWRCPQHSPDKRPSLMINPGKNCWLCGPCGASGNAWELAAFIAGKDPKDKPAITAWLNEYGLLGASSGRIREHYYQDSHGRDFRKVRFEPKHFRWEHLATDGHWKPGLNKGKPLALECRIGGGGVVLSMVGIRLHIV